MYEDEYIPASQTAHETTENVEPMIEDGLKVKRLY